MQLRNALALILLMLAGALQAQDDATPQPEAAESSATKPLLRWRVGASLGLSNSTLITEPKFDSTMGNEGLVGEFAISGRVTHRDSGVSASMRLCWGCHGIELEEAAIEWRPMDFVHIKAGRMAFAAGAYNNRHDFNTRRTISKPLIRNMGGMVRQREFNLGVLPAPLVSNGLSAVMDFNAGPVGISLEGMAFVGLQGTVLGPDVDFVASRRYFDNNDEPSLGARLGIELPSLSLNFSWLWGNYDPESRRSYNIATADARLRLGPVTLDAEFAWRETEYDSPGSSGGEAHFQKFGWLLLVDWQVVSGLHLTAAVDTLHVTNIFLADFGPTTNQAFAITDDNNRIVRLTGGITYITAGGLMLRANVEYWEFSDFNDVWVAQGGIGWAF